MSSNILDQAIWDNAALLQVLQNQGFPKAYELQDGSIVVEQSSSIKIRIHAQDQLTIKAQFPEIGNGIQIFSTIAFGLLFSYIGFPFSWFIAIAVGQVVSYLYYRPKALQLKKKVEDLLQQQK